ncbi:MAG: taurine dioxygenase [Candidatus Hydrogenedentota bacterium]|nr:MAG: taurine dioxygenase [Candidatus Hydrogenedentota bacterium]
MSYEQIKVTPLAGALGAEISGVDLSAEIGDDVFREIQDAFHEHLVIFFRNQNLTPNQQKDFSRRFGSLIVHPFVKPLDGHPEIIPIIKEKEDKMNFGGGWHSDVSFMEEPALGSVLYAKETPPFGGDTLWSNQYLAYEALSDGMKDMLGGLKAVHSASRQYGAKGESAKNNDKRKTMEVAVTDEADAFVEHPVVRTHAATGRKSLYVNEGFTQKFAGMTKRESRPLLQYLYTHCNSEPFTCRFRWEDNSMAFWDNRCTQHYALNDYHGHRREMHRVTINGERPA